MTQGSADEEGGIALVETIARHVNAGLTIGDASPRPVDTVTWVITRPGVTWAAAGELLGVGGVALLQSINGGEAATLSGQRVCAP